LTDENIFTWFDVNVTIGCFYETSISNNLDAYQPYSADYDFAFALPLANTADESTFFFSTEFAYDLFITEIQDCWASNLALCWDSECTSLVDEAFLNFTSNPVSKEPSGPPIAELNVDMRNISLYEEIYIHGSTLNPDVSASLKILVAVCGEKFEYAASDPDS
jgi:hypothetical protein